MTHDYLSNIHLHGNEGPQGPQGLTGAQGPQGPGGIPTGISIGSGGIPTGISIGSTNPQEINHFLASLTPEQLAQLARN